MVIYRPSDKGDESDGFYILSIYRHRFFLYTHKRVHIDSASLPSLPSLIGCCGFVYEECYQPENDIRLEHFLKLGWSLNQI